MNKDRIAIIAGDGVLPVMLANRLAEKDLLSLLIVLQGPRERFAGIGDAVHEVPIGRVKKTRDLLVRYGINKLILIGKIDKNGFIERKGLDLMFLRALKRFKDGKDTTIFQVILDEFTKMGIEVLPQDRYLTDMIIDKGVLTKRKPAESEIEDARFGIEHAKKLATMDIGQTVVVKNKTIIAVEAVEGTNETIKRGAALCKGGAVICKAAREEQDKRFDIPGIGRETLEIMLDSGVKMLALEANKILVVDVENVIGFADKKKISIIAI